MGIPEICVGCQASNAAMCWGCFAAPANKARRLAGEVFQLRAAKRDLLASLREQLDGDECDPRDPCSDGFPCRACRARKLIRDLTTEGTALETDCAPKTESK